MAMAMLFAQALVLSLFGAHVTADYCFYNASRLPDLVKTCLVNSPQFDCYYDWVGYFNGVEPDMIQQDTLTGKILFCDYQTVPDDIKQTCSWANDGVVFMCGPPGAPRYNIRSVVSTEHVDIGAFDLKESLWSHLDSQAGSFAVITSNQVLVHGKGCWHTLDAKEPLHNVQVKVFVKASWGTLNMPDIGHPVVHDNKFVRDWLISALKPTLESVRREYPIYYGCASSPWRNGKPIPCISSSFNCSAATEKGCGYANRLTGEAKTAKCPKYCYGAGPCRQSAPGNVVPQEITTTIYDRDQPTKHTITVSFEAKEQADTRDISERLISLLPAFFAFIPLEAEAAFFVGLMWNIVSVDCAVRFRSKQPTSQHL